MRRRLLEFVGDLLFLADHAGHARICRRRGTDDFNDWHVRLRCSWKMPDCRTCVAPGAVRPRWKYFTNWLSLDAGRNLSSGRIRRMRPADHRTATMNSRGNRKSTLPSKRGL